MNVYDFIVRKDSSVREAMKQLDRTAQQILFVVDSDLRLCYSLSDGDIRRYLLSGGKLSGKVCQAGYENPKFAKNLEEANKIYDAKYCTAVPIVDDDKRIIDIFFGNDQEVKVYSNLSIPVVINAGGKGTRLDPYTRVLPKPLIPVGELPIIEHIMQEYVKYGCVDFHMIVNYKKQLIKTYFTESDNKYSLSFYDEEKPLGTGGGLCFLKGVINSTFFFTNCDNLLRTDYEGLLNFHREQRNDITMVCAYKNITIPYGVVEMGLNGTIDKMQEKPELSFLTNTGIYVVEPEVLENIEYGVPIGFPDIINREIKMGRRISVYPVNESQWMDMGQISELEKMRKQLYGE